jgi:hypothetical protein
MLHLRNRVSVRSITNVISQYVAAFEYDAGLEIMRYL